MKKAEALRMLRKIEGKLEDHELVSDLVHQLAEIVEEYWPKTVEKIADPSGYPLPNEIVDGELAIFSDGACRGNPGPGAWACMGQSADGKIVLESSGVAVPTTNNIMEMTGALEGIKMAKMVLEEEGQLNSDMVIRVYSDSKYLVDGMKSWVEGWKRRGWKKADKKTPENVEIWQELDAIRNELKEVSFHWVKGHAGHPQNEYCDSMANKALDEAGY